MSLYEPPSYKSVNIDQSKIPELSVYIPECPCMILVLTHRSFNNNDQSMIPELKINLPQISCMSESFTGQSKIPEVSVNIPQSAFIIRPVTHSLYGTKKNFDLSQMPYLLHATDEIVPKHVFQHKDNAIALHIREKNR